MRIGTVKLTAAQVLTLNSAPIVLRPTPGAGYRIKFHSAYAYLSAGTAFGGIAAGENLEFRYSNTTGTLLAVCETVGFLDQTTAEDRDIFPNDGTVAVMEIDGAPDTTNEPLIICLASGDITGGGSRTLQITFWYDLIKIV